MRRMAKYGFPLMGILLAWLAVGQERFPPLRLNTIELPPGFTIDVFARVPDARSLALGDRGTVFVGSRTYGKVYAVIDRNRDYKADEVLTIAEGLVLPNGIAFRNGALYVAESHRILRFDRIEERLRRPPKPVVVRDGFPTEAAHGWRYIRFGPDGKLYMGIGAPCNVCEVDPDRYAVILRMNPDGSGLEVFARGVRNTVGFDWHPVTKELWFTDNGRDGLGDDIPPDELNRAPRAGLHFGYPHCFGKAVVDPDFAKGRSCGEFTLPVLELIPHAGALGMVFYTGKMFPTKYRNQIFIAEHGSWDRSVPIGYRIMLVRLSGNQPITYEPFAEGWLQGTRAWGRPVDLLILPDGSLLVSDDQAHAIYRISYSK